MENDEKDAKIAPGNFFTASIDLSFERTLGRDLLSFTAVNLFMVFVILSAFPMAVARRFPALANVMAYAKDGLGIPGVMVALFLLLPFIFGVSWFVFKGRGQTPAIFSNNDKLFFDIVMSVSSVFIILTVLLLFVTNRQSEWKDSSGFLLSLFLSSFPFLMAYLYFFNLIFWRPRLGEKNKKISARPFPRLKRLSVAQLVFLILGCPILIIMGTALFLGQRQISF
jgi:hypothetical protein